MKSVSNPSRHSKGRLGRPSNSWTSFVNRSVLHRVIRAGEFPTPFRTRREKKTGRIHIKADGDGGE